MFQFRLQSLFSIVAACAVVFTSIAFLYRQHSIQQARSEEAEAFLKEVRNSSDAMPLLILGLSSEEQLVRLRVAQYLRSLGSGAKPAISALVAAMSDPDEDVQSEASFALAQIGEAAVPAVIESLKHQRSVHAALRTVAKLGDKASVATPFIIELLKTSRGEERELAIDALTSLGTSAVPALASLLNDESEGVRAGEMQALGRIDLPAVETVVNATREPRVSLQAQSQLDYWMFFGPPSARTMVIALTHRDIPLRVIAIDTLSSLGSAAKDALPALYRMSHDDDEDPKIHIAAQSAIQRIEAE